MAEAAVQLEIEGLDSLSAKVGYLMVALGDMRPLWEQFSADFYKDEKRLFQLKGPGKFEDLSPSYKEQKQEEYGFVYPILFREGRLASALLSRSAFGSVNVIETDFFQIGVDAEQIPYAKWHQEGTARMPARPMFETDENSALFTRWNRMADAYVKKIIEGAL